MKAQTKSIEKVVIGVMRTSQIELIKKVVKENRFVSDRVKKLNEMGYSVNEYPMGSGGVLQQKKMSDGTIRIQIGYGHGKHNYAMAVVL